MVLWRQYIIYEYTAISIKNRNNDYVILSKLRCLESIEAFINFCNNVNPSIGLTDGINDNME